MRHGRLQTKTDHAAAKRVTALESVGLYVPGGTAAYPSSVIMNAVPAQVAGVKRIAVTTPPGTLMQSPIVAAALRELGLYEVYSVGGAQAIAALAHGTKTIARVDKIVGPGNIYVATAKRLVFGTVGIDCFAGPTEIVVLADDTAKPHYVTADLLSQAEHDPRASAICITTSMELAKEVQVQLKTQLETLNRANIAATSLQEYGAIIVFENLSAGMRLYQYARARASGNYGRRPGTFAGAHSQRRRNLYRRIFQRAGWRLFHWPRSHIADGWHGQILFATGCFGFRKAHKRYQIYESEIAKDGP